jgi:hypothetical protein
MFTLDQVVPWGRSFEEYRRMFALSDADLQLRILGCADGPASFNAEATRFGTTVISTDPLYRLDTPTIRDRIAATYDQMLEEAQRNSQQLSGTRSPQYRNWAASGCKPCAHSWTTTIWESAKAGTLTLNSHLSPSRANHLTWHFAHTFSFYTRSTCLKASIGPQFSNCVASPLR